jgi:hypothetical protein
MNDGRIWVLALAVACALGGCGDALDDGKFQGIPRFELAGTVRSTARDLGGQPSFVAVLWDNFMRQGDIATSQKTGLQASEFPATFTLRLYDEPTLTSLNDLNHPDLGTEGYLGTGYILAFEDIDGDGELGPTRPAGPGKDRIWARAPRQMLLFAKDLNPEAILKLRESGMIENPEALQPGFNLAETICRGPGELHDRLRVVGAGQVTLEAVDAPGVVFCLEIT